MKAQTIKKFGDPSVFELAELPKPELKPGHALIKVCATSANRIDCKIRSGAVPAISPDFPAVLHGDVAGIVEAVADDVQDFKVGDEVYGCAGGLKGSGGALAEFMPVDAKLIAKKPKSLSMREAAALPLVSITAWDALFVKGKLKAKQNILIHGGVGGVGHIALQLAKWCDVNVFTTVRSNEDAALAKSFGANETINFQEESVQQYVARLTDSQGFEMIFDTIGGENLDRSLAAAKINGHVITTVSRSIHDLTPMHSKALSLHVVFMLIPLLKNEGRAAHGEILTKLASIVDEGKLKPLVDPNEFTLDTVANAHTLLESGNAKGKVVITIA